MPQCFLRFECTEQRLERHAFKCDLKKGHKQKMLHFETLGCPIRYQHKKGEDQGTYFHIACTSVPSFWVNTESIDKVTDSEILASMLGDDPDMVAFLPELSF